MNDSQVAPRPLLTDALQQFRTHGGVSLPGRVSDPYQRWQNHRKTSRIVFLIVGTFGVVAVLGGRDVGVFVLLIPLGGFLAFVGLSVAVILILVGGAHSFRLRAETQPVVLDAWGIRLRGIGPIPWGDVAPPEYRKILTKNDVSGMCTVMPLSPQGHARVNANLSSQSLLVSPRPYLRGDIPFLLLPGIDGLMEAETAQLFHKSYAMRTG